MCNRFRFVTLIALYSCLLAPVSAATHSFDPSTGTLSVDFRSYLSKNDIVFNGPFTDSINALTVGNGCVGAMVYNKNQITAQVTGVDASPQTQFSSGLINLQTNPALDASITKMQQYLALYDGVVKIDYDTNRTVTFFGAPKSEILGIHVRDGRSVNGVTFTISIWPSATVGTKTGNMAIEVANQDDWKAYTSYADANSAGVSRAQKDSWKFGLTLAATVEGTAFTTKQVDDGTVQLTITPAKEYTIWVACASRLNAPGNNSVTHAQTLLDSVKTIGYTKTIAAYKSFWNSFWEKSFVQFSNSTKDADYCENFYYLSNYLIASGSFGNYPFQHINGVYRWSWDIGIHWGVGYWYWNQRDLYNSFLVSNRPDVISSFYRLYTRNTEKFKSLASSQWKVIGVWIPETIRYDGEPRLTSGFTDRILSTGAEVAYNMYNRFRFTNDSVFLRDTAYPMMKETARFLSNMLSNSNGTYYMANSNSHETYWAVKNSLIDLAAIRCLFPRAIEVSKALNMDSDLRTDWQNKLDHLVPFGTENYNGGKRYLAYDNGPATSANSHNVENIGCELQWPYDISGIGRDDLPILINNYNSRPFKYNEPWSQDAIYAARIGLGDSAFGGMKYMLSKYQTYSNGFTNNTNGVFEYEGTSMIAMNEMLLQSHFDTIRVFPAMPSGTITSKFTLTARGGFLVSSERENGEIKYVGLKSLFGEKCKIFNPWGTEAVQIRSTSDNKVIVTSSSGVISFETDKGRVYVLERTASPLSNYTFAKITGTPNGSAKKMSFAGKTLTLGMGTGNPPSEDPTSAIPAARKDLHFAAINISKSNTGWRIKFTTLKSETVTLQVCNLKGDVIKTETFEVTGGISRSKELNMSNAVAGPYIIKFTGDANGSFVSKVILLNKVL